MATRLSPVGTRLHGDGWYLVKVKEFNKREDETYALIAKFDEAVEHRAQDRAVILQLQQEKAQLLADLRTLKSNIMRLVST